MGLFDFLLGGKSKSNVQSTGDRIWLSEEAKYRGVRKELAERSRSGSIAVILVAHFPDVLHKLQAIATESKGDGLAMAALARDLSSQIAAGLSLDGSAIVDLIVAERHPLPEVDDQVLRFAESLPCRCRVSHHLSLDDPLVKQFAGEWVENVLKQLGMHQDEAIESNMVARRIRAAQEKIAAGAIGNSEADSAAQWLEKNLPGGSD